MQLLSEQYSSERRADYFDKSESFSSGGVEDDHIPFVRLGMLTVGFSGCVDVRPKPKPEAGAHSAHEARASSCIALSVSSLDLSLYLSPVGVPALHLISYPFPSVWHRLSDDAAHVKPWLCADLLRVFRVFLGGLLRLDAASTDSSHSHSQSQSHSQSDSAGGNLAERAADSLSNRA